MHREVRMEHVTELRLREQRLRAKVRASVAGDRITTDADRRWIVRELSSMEMIFESHLGEVARDDRDYERYRLEFELPTFNYLRRTYALFYPEAVAEAVC